MWIHVTLHVAPSFSFFFEYFSNFAQKMTIDRQTDVRLIAVGLCCCKVGAVTRTHAVRASDFASVSC
jgi:hypothetical protein